MYSLRLQTLDFIIKNIRMWKIHRLHIATSEWWPILVGDSWMNLFCQFYYDGHELLVYQNNKMLKVVGENLNKLGGGRMGKRVYRSVNFFSLPRLSPYFPEMSVCQTWSRAELLYKAGTGPVSNFISLTKVNRVFSSSVAQLVSGAL